MDPIIINISSEKLLDYIFKEDHELILKIKKGILENWEHKNIKPRIDSAVVAELGRKIDLNIKRTIKEHVDEHFKYEELEPYVKEQISRILNKIINDDDQFELIIKEKVNELVQKTLKKIKK
jgi:hypothetical protein